MNNNCISRPQSTQRKFSVFLSEHCGKATALAPANTMNTCTRMSIH